MPSVLSAPLTPDQVTEALKLLHVEFEYMLDTLKVEKDVQAKLASWGIRTKPFSGRWKMRFQKCAKSYSRTWASTRTPALPTGPQSLA